MSRGNDWALPFAASTLTWASAVYFFSAPVADNDLWGHLFFGREILAAGSLPVSNLHSYTAASYPWINHEILAECIFAWIFDHLGAAGLLALKLVLGLATAVLLYRSARLRTKDVLGRTTSLVLATSLMSYGYLVRPQLFTFLALAWLWHQLQRYATGDRRGSWMIPVLFALWVNTHGGVLAGITVLLLFAAFYSPTAPKAADAKCLAALGAASLAALMMNPYGTDLPLFLFRDVLRDRPITEWSPIPLLGFSNLHFKAAVLIAALGLFLRRELRLWEIIPIGVAAIAAFRHERHVPLFAILATPYLAETFGLWIGRLRLRSGAPSFSPGARALLVGGLLLIAATQTISVIRMQWQLRLQIFVSPEEFPVDAVRFLQYNRLRGNIAVPFGWGEYVIWHLFPYFRVSIDGRYTTAYPDDVIDQAWRYMEGSPGWDKILEGATIALADRRHATASRLAANLNWRLIYSDDTALLFARQGVALPATLLRQQRLDAGNAFFFP